MTSLVKRYFYLINILTIILMVILILFSINSIRTNYKHLIKTSYSIEKEYHAVFDKYKKIIVFLLKNKLPIDRANFNFIGEFTYNLHPVEEFYFFEKGGIQKNNGKVSNNPSISVVTECYKNKCIKVYINNKEILNEILKNKSGIANDIFTLPIKKLALLRFVTQSFLETHKSFLFVTLTYLFVLYFLQSLFLLRKNHNLVKTNIFLTKKADKNQQELNKQLTKSNMLHNNVLFTAELTNEYFTHYIHQLLARDVCPEEIQLIEVLHRIEKLFNYQLIKKDLKIILDYTEIKTITIDNEIIFLVLLNSIYKAINRSKMSSDVAIKISQAQNTTTVEINDNGYEYNTEPDDKIRVYELPKPILEKLCQKAKIRIVETKKDMSNIIKIEIINSEIGETEEVNEPTNKTIKIRLTPLWQ